LQSFSLEQRIPPSEVTLDLLKQLERVMLDDIASRSAPSSGEAQPEYSIAITDSFGTETLTTIADYRPLLLPNTTSAVVVKFQNPYRSLPRIKVDIAFNLNRDFSAVKVDVTDDSAREVAMGVAEKLRQVLAPQRRSHAFLHPGMTGEVVRTVLGAIGIPTAVVGAIAANNTTVTILVTIFTVLVLAHWFAGRSLRPYIIFDSQRNRGRAAIWNWFIFGLLTFVVFSTALVAFRKSLLGF